MTTSSVTWTEVPCISDVSSVLGALPRTFDVPSPQLCTSIKSVGFVIFSGFSIPRNLVAPISYRSSISSHLPLVESTHSVTWDPHCRRKRMAFDAKLPICTYFGIPNLYKTRVAQVSSEFCKDSLFSQYRAGLQMTHSTDQLQARLSC